jgi:23S rRNA pseudouridine2605 synthase
VTTEAQKPLKTLERVLSKAGIGSRSQARSWIHAGRATVNGKPTQNPDQWVDLATDVVRFDGKPLPRPELRYVLLHKPTGYLTTRRDPEGRPTVYDLLAGIDSVLPYVGRLDLDTSGLLLLTNDTALAEHVTNPDHKVPKTYLVEASAAFTERHLQQLRDGILTSRRRHPSRRRSHARRDHDHRGAQSADSTDGRIARCAGAEPGTHADRPHSDRCTARRSMAPPDAGRGERLAPGQTEVAVAKSCGAPPCDVRPRLSDASR